jgi:hypothetical protein
MVISTERDRAWLPTWRAHDLARLAGALALLAAVPGSWCVVVPVVESAHGGDIVFAIGGGAFVVLLTACHLVGHCADRRGLVEEREREASWSALSTRTCERRAAVEGAAARTFDRIPVIELVGGAAGERVPGHPPAGAGGG